MKALTVDVRQSTGRVLCSTIFRPGGKKLLAKGHLLSEEDVKLLETEGMREVWVTELEEGEVGEDQAVTRVGMEMGCGALEIRLAAGGRANLIATEPACNLIDEELLKQINCTSSIAIATMPNFSYADPGQRVATVKSAPFAIAQAELEAVTNILTERGRSCRRGRSGSPARRSCTRIRRTAIARGRCLRASCISGWSGIRWAGCNRWR